MPIGPIVLLLALGIGGSLVPAFPLPAATPFAPHSSPDRKPPRMRHATGTFDVTLTPQTMAHTAEGYPLGRYALEKRYHGDLEATAFGEMLAAGTAEPTSAGYVAVEEVRGTLHGRHGSFVLQHTGTMNRGTATLSVSIVPDSGTEALAGITGTLQIVITGGVHRYELDYTLPGGE